jgi:hypothetical protein
MGLKRWEYRLFFVYYYVGLVMKKTIKAMEADWIFDQITIGKS